MRRVLGYIAVELGLFLITLAPFLYFYTTPRIEKAPTDVYNVTISNGQGKIFSAKTFSVVGPMPLQNVSIAKGVPSASTHDVAVISIFGKVIDATTKEAIDYSQDIYAMNRTTGQAVHCCGENPPAEGTTLKFPFGTKKHVYQFYDSTAHKAFPAHYQRTETIDGLVCYVFRSYVPKTFLETMSLPGFVADSPQPSVRVQRWYEAITTVWVEPTTGAIIKGAQIASQWTTLGDQFVTTLANTNFVNSPASVRETANQVKPKLSQLLLVSVWLPILGPVIGAVLVALGLLLRRKKRKIRRARVDLETAELATAE